MQKDDSGQALVLVLLSLSVVLTLILYILSRSVTDVAVSSRQEEAVRAFSAAEAGIERSLVVGTGFPETGIGNASYTTSVTSFASGSGELSFPSPVSYGDVVTVWFVSHDNSGKLVCNPPPLPCYFGTQMKVCWGNPGTPRDSLTTPAVELSVYYESPANSGFANLNVGRVLVDPNSGRSAGNAFIISPDWSAGTCQIGNQTYAFQKTINFSDMKIPAGSYGAVNGMQLAQIRMLYNSDVSQAVGVGVTGSTLPSQGKVIDSSGFAGDINNRSNRRIIVYQSWPEFPFTSSTIISPVGIIKN